MLMPVLWVLNKNYYITIRNVNYWEEKEVVGLIKYILENTNYGLVKDNLKGALEDIRYLAITIKKGNNVIIDKGIEEETVDRGYVGHYEVNDYEILVRRRNYPDYFEDYKNYVRALNPWNSVYWKQNKDESKVGLNRYIKNLAGDKKSVLHHLNLTILISQLAIIFFLETIFLLISIKHRLRTIKNEMSTLKRKMYNSERKNV